MSYWGAEEWFYAILIGIVVIFGVLFSFGAMLIGGPVIIVSYIISMILMITCFAVVKETDKKFIYTGIIAFCYAFIFWSVYHLKFASDEQDDLVFLTIMTFTLMVPRYFIGREIARIIEVNSERKKEEKEIAINGEIECLKKDNKEIEMQISSYERELRLLELLEKCGASTGALIQNQQFGSIVKLRERMENNSERITELEAELFNLM